MILDIIVKSIDFIANTYVGEDNLTRAIEPETAYLLGKTDGSGEHDRYVTDQHNIISKASGGSEEVAGSTPLVEITYAELSVLKDIYQLVPGQQYRITDYVCTTNTDSYWYQSAQNKFDIIVTADSVNSLNENARAIKNNLDSYFPESTNFATWELKYTIDNNITKYTWADDVNGKGVIYWMKDDKGNELYYDFKSIQFVRHKIIGLDNANVGTHFLNRYFGLPSSIGMQGNFIIDELDFIFAYTFCNPNDNSFSDSSLLEVDFFNTGFGVTSNKVGYTLYQNAEGFELGNNVFFTHNMNLNTIGYNAYNNTIANSMSSNIIGDYMNNNTINDGFTNNNIGINFISNIILDYFFSNTVGDAMRNNNIGSDANSNIIGNDMRSNIIGDSMNSNTIGNNFNSNNIGNSMYSNTIWHTISYNTIGNDMRSNIIGDSMNSNTIGNDMRSNIIGDSMDSNTIGDNMGYNTIGDNMYNNNIGDSMNSNTIGNTMRTNVIGYNMVSNTIGNGMVSNTIGNSMVSNTIGNDMLDNTIGDYTQSNIIGDDVSYTDLGGGLTNITTDGLGITVKIDNGVKGGSINNSAYIRLNIQAQFVNFPTTPRVVTISQSATVATYIFESKVSAETKESFNYILPIF